MLKPKVVQMDAEIVRQKKAYDVELGAWMDVRTILKRLGERQLRAMQLQPDKKAARFLSRLKWLSHTANSLVHRQQQEISTLFVSALLGPTRSLCHV